MNKNKFLCSLLLSAVKQAHRLFSSCRDSALAFLELGVSKKDKSSPRLFVASYPNVCVQAAPEKPIDGGWSQDSFHLQLWFCSWHPVRFISFLLQISRVYCLSESLGQWTDRTVNPV